MKKEELTKSSKTGIENRTRVLLAIAKKPSSFQELLKELALTRPTLLSHIKSLQKKGSIYRDTIKPDETSNPKEVGKVVYRASLHHIAKTLMEAISLYDVFSEAFDVEKISKESEKRTSKIPEDKLRSLTPEKQIMQVHRKLERLKQQMVEVVCDYFATTEARRRLRSKDNEGANNED